MGILRCMHPRGRVDDASGIVFLTLIFLYLFGIGLIPLELVFVLPVVVGFILMVLYEVLRNAVQN